MINTDIPAMVGNKKNGQLSLTTKARRKKRKRQADPCALSRVGPAIWNAMTGRYVTDKSYYRIRADHGIDLAELERNNWITSFNGTMTDEEFLNQQHVKDFQNPPVESVTPLVTGFDESSTDDNTIMTIGKRNQKAVQELKQEGGPLIDVVVNQARDIDNLNRVIRDLRKEMERDNAHLSNLHVHIEACGVALRAANNEYHALARIPLEEDLPF